jgi:shikimate kinase/3-dehydroquinate synthase
VTATSPEKIALIGFMGAGKTTVGALLAKGLGLPFYDLDALISERTQQSVATIFARRGPTTFRTYERAALRELLERDEACVFATGGGTVADPSALQHLKQVARCVHLRVPLDVAMQRLSQDDGLKQRPMLWGPDAMATATRLYQERQFYYIQAHLSVDAQNGTPQQVARRVADALGLSFDPVGIRAANDNLTPRFSAKIPIDAVPAAPLGPVPAVGSSSSQTLSIRSHLRTYTVQVAGAAEAFLSNALPQSCRGNDVLLLCDAKVHALHGERVLKALQAAGKRVECVRIPADEQHKSLEEASRLYGLLSEYGLGRNATLVALGGGMIGDLAGFVAATYMRGIGLVSLPTSTMAAVDASIGGKNALNTPRAKNLVGTFYPPDAVFIGLDMLKTQSVRQHASGLVEVVKMAATHDSQLFARLLDQSDALLRFAEPQLGAALLAALQIKARVVELDETDTDGRAVLNFGHTLGHAIELGEAYRLLHGEAVALGMLAETAWAIEEGLVSAAIYGALEQTLRALQVPVDWRRARVSLQALQLDKKRENAQVRLPLVVQLGSHAWHSANLNSLAKFVA